MVRTPKTLGEMGRVTDCDSNHRIYTKSSSRGFWDGTTVVDILIENDAIALQGD